MPLIMQSVETTATLSDIASKLDYIYTAIIFVIGLGVAGVVCFILYKAIISWVEF